MYICKSLPRDFDSAGLEWSPGTCIIIIPTWCHRSDIWGPTKLLSSFDILRVSVVSSAEEHLSQQPLLWKGTIKGQEFCPYSVLLSGSHQWEQQPLFTECFYAVRLSAHAKGIKGFSNMTLISAATLPSSSNSLSPTNEATKKLWEAEKIAKSPWLQKGGIRIWTHSCLIPNPQV